MAGIKIPEADLFFIHAGSLGRPLSSGNAWSVEGKIGASAKLSF
jgi:hypothetical protein